MTVAMYIAGATQASHRADVRDPAAMMGRAVRMALADASLSEADVDALACVEPLSWNYDDLGTAVAAHAGLADTVGHRWVPAGGTSPLDLLHQLGPDFSAGALNCAVICGAESMRSRRRGRTDGWPERAAGVNAMRGQRAFSSALERAHGLTQPIHLFPMIENALQAAHGRTADQQRAIAAGLLERNAKVAADNPYAWFHDAPDAAAIGTSSADNRMIVHPYTKRMNAIMDVDQSAAIVVVSAAFADRHRLRDRAAAVLAGAGAEETWNPIERDRWDVCRAMERAFRHVFDEAAITTTDLDAMDLYSCFPSAIELALDALAIGVDDERPVSLTGGLAFAGGPGNAYVLHSLAAALEHLRTRR